MNLLLSPHNDDETLFTSFTILRERPLVVFLTDSFIQLNRGDGITAEERNKESKQAMEVLNCDYIFANLRDDLLSRDVLRDYFKELVKFNPDKVYAPKPYLNGNEHHNMVGEIAEKMFGDKVVFYATYTKDNLYTTGKTEIKPTNKELILKRQALQCYRSQLSLGATRPHFEAVLGQSEFYD